LNLDEDAVACDLAETYHILDYRALPLRLVAKLVFGLRGNSRIKLEASGMKHPLETVLLAGILDNTRMLMWMQSKDGQRGTNRPALVTDIVLHGAPERSAEQDVQAFEDGAAFERARAEILNRKEESPIGN
jgi:hypothetical protein